MTVNRSALAAIGVAGVLAAGAAIPAIAQDGGDTATDQATEATTDDATTPEARREAHEEEFAAALADELGLDQQTVQDAIDAVREDMRTAREAEMQERFQSRLDDLVASGELTQEEADTLAGIQERGVLRDGLGGFGRRGHRGGPGFGPFGGPGDAPDADATVEGTSA